MKTLLSFWQLADPISWQNQGSTLSVCLWANAAGLVYSGHPPVFSGSGVIETPPRVSFEDIFDDELRVIRMTLARPLQV